VDTVFEAAKKGTKEPQESAPGDSGERWDKEQRRYAQHNEPYPRRKKRQVVYTPQPRVRLIRRGGEHGKRTR